MLTQTSVKISTQNGMVPVPAMVIDLIPGLAVSMSNFGVFSVTHVNSGFQFSETASFSDALWQMCVWGLIGREHFIDWTQDKETIIEAINAIDDEKVPLDAGDYTIQNWRQMQRAKFLCDELDLDPAFEILEKLENDSHGNTQ